MYIAGQVNSFSHRKTHKQTNKQTNKETNKHSYTDTMKIYEIKKMSSLVFYGISLNKVIHKPIQNSL